MRVIEPKPQIVDNDWPLERRLAWAAAICYDKQDSIAGLSDDECLKKVQGYYKKGHMSVLEMHRMKIRLFSSASLYVAKNEYRGTPWVDFSGRLMVASLRVLLESQIKELKQVGNAILSGGEKEWEHLHAYRLSGASLGEAEPVMVRIECSLNIATQIIRHRPCSFLQMSQRYNDMSDLPVVIPEAAGGAVIEKLMLVTSNFLEAAYKVLRNLGLKRQAARAVLPNMTATKLLVLTSVHHWRHIFRLRCGKAADPEMRRIMIPLEAEFGKRRLI